MGEHGLHAGPSDDATRHVIVEDLHDLIAAVFRELAAPVSWLDSPSQRVVCLAELTRQ